MSLSNKFSNISNRLISDFVFQQVMAVPDNIALAIEDREYTYAQLWSLADAIYHRIPKDKTYNHIGIYCQNDIYTYASIIAVNMYGAAYVPLNDAHPVVRNKSAIAQCRIEVVLSSSVFNEDIKSLKERVEVVDVFFAEEPTIKKFDYTQYRKVQQPMCYVLFTSGTTGKPKGVPVSHDNVQHFFDYFLQTYSFRPEDRFLQVYELSFDVSVFSFFMPLITGACCVVLPKEGMRYLKIAACLQQYRISVVSMVPTVLRYLESYMHELRFPQLRYSFFSGDALLHHLALKWKRCLPQGEIHNFYGPTETTIVCSRYIFEEQQAALESVNNIVPIGQLFPGHLFLIVDEKNNPVDKGELCIAGPQVISSYLNEQQEEQFFVHAGQRYYKTGDIVSLNEYGNLVFYGRTDSQVKINGYRVELAEVENAVHKVSGCNNIVLSTTNANNMQELTVYLETEHVNIAALKQKLEQLLPEYMLPKQYVTLCSFPLNENGKADKNRLKQLSNE